MISLLLLPKAAGSMVNYMLPVAHFIHYFYQKVAKIQSMRIN